MKDMINGFITSYLKGIEHCDFRVDVNTYVTSICVQLNECEQLETSSLKILNLQHYNFMIINFLYFRIVIF
jgi:hypothetical protein